MLHLGCAGDLTAGAPRSTNNQTNPSRQHDQRP